MEFEGKICLGRTPYKPATCWSNGVRGVKVSKGLTARRSVIGSKGAVHMTLIRLGLKATWIEI